MNVYWIEAWDIIGVGQKQYFVNPKYLTLVNKTTLDNIKCFEMNSNLTELATVRLSINRYYLAIEYIKRILQKFNTCIIARAAADFAGSFFLPTIIMLANWKCQFVELF
jgi:hypothetical protein